MPHLFRRGVMLMLLGAVIGCGADNSVEIPDDPVPPPSKEPESMSNSAPADD